VAFVSIFCFFFLVMCLLFLYRFMYIKSLRRVLYASSWRVFHYDYACIAVISLLLFELLSSDWLRRGLSFFTIHFSIPFLYDYYSCIFALLFLFFLFRELFCKLHVKLIAPTAYVPFTQNDVRFLRLRCNASMWRNFALSCYSTVDKILRTVITSIFVGICGCPIRIQLIALHKYGLQEDMLISCIFIAIFKHRTVKSHGRFFNFLLFLTCFCSRSRRGIQFRTYLLSVERLKDVVWAQPFCSPGNISPLFVF
jgi:hypothetical protein